MASGILSVVIDERKKMAQIDENEVIRANQQFAARQNQDRSVFKDYILSSEIFYIDISR
ncbi:hypothetical protein [Vampirovibrio chlorellavorus]|uniref:hypothetical protein n=1 Tax=Vampirovibrio chlorellavorus TaxID=758823 RepID=UPI0026F1A018|nr:hypothetical protein [Vampirovibrio chlorellavorus]